MTEKCNCGGIRKLIETIKEDESNKEMFDNLRNGFFESHGVLETDIKIKVRRMKCNKCGQTICMVKCNVS